MPRAYTYGPFKSRRLGLSLGVNILPEYKLCTFNCVYCEIGPTYQVVPPDYRIKAPPSPQYRNELKDILKYVPHLNSITFGYFGEPTLNENILDFLQITLEVRKRLQWTHQSPITTLFTNSSTLHFEEIRNRVKQFDLILAKLDVATEDDFKRTNRPHTKVQSIELIIESLIKLKKEMLENKLALQCLIYNSYSNDFVSNNNDENIKKLGLAIKKIKPDIVQIYSVARIPSEYDVYSISKERKQQIVKKIKEIIKNDSIEINYY